MKLEARVYELISRIADLEEQLAVRDRELEAAKQHARELEKQLHVARRAA